MLELNLDLGAKTARITPIDALPDQVFEFSVGGFAGQEATGEAIVGLTEIEPTPLCDGRGTVDPVEVIGETLAHLFAGKQ
jgi:hypothetical protein